MGSTPGICAVPSEPDSHECAEIDEGAFVLMFDELRHLARKLFAHQPDEHTLQATALVNEAWLRMCRKGGASWNDRAHFLRSAARAMGQILVDCARRKRAAKRLPVERRIEFEGILDVFEARARCNIFEFQDALQGLPKRHQELVEMRFYAGYSVDECSQLLGRSRRQIARDWGVAKTLLKETLGV